MKTLIITVLALLAMVNYPDFSGKWSYVKGESTSFDLELTQKDSVVTGSHFAVMLGGNRIDGEFDDTQTISGVIRNGELIINIKSGYGNGTGKAKLTFVGQDSIYFEFITPPKGEYWIPNKVILTKEKKEEE